MSTLEPNIIPFRPADRSFLFDDMAQAQTFIETFGALLLLEPVISRDAQGKFLVQPEPLESEYACD